MREFKIGSVCEVIGSDWHPELIGAEVTITGPLQEFYNEDQDYSWFGYPTDFETETFRFCPDHKHLRLKRFPPEDEQWCRQVMSKLLTPLPQEIITKITEEVE